MSIFEKQAQLGKSLFQINTSILRELVSLQRENFGKYVQLNQEFGKKLPEVTSISEFVSLQNEYNESLWSGMRTAMSSQTQVLKTAVEETGAAFTSAYSNTEAA